MLRYLKTIISFLICSLQNSSWVSCSLHNLGWVNNSAIMTNRTVLTPPIAFFGPISGPGWRLGPLIHPPASWQDPRFHGLVPGGLNAPLHLVQLHANYVKCTVVRGLRDVDSPLNWITVSPQAERNKERYTVIIADTIWYAVKEEPLLQKAIKEFSVQFNRQKPYFETDGRVN